MAASVGLTPSVDRLLLKDSKQLTPPKRQLAFDHLVQMTPYIGVGIVSHAEIDHLNVLTATLLAMKHAFFNITIPPETQIRIQVDGTHLPSIEGIEMEAIIRGDQVVPEISAASIVAKVIRDRIMVSLDRTYPEYGFTHNKGYGTRLHFDSIFKKGRSPVHRKTFSISQQLRLF